MINLTEFLYDIKQRRKIEEGIAITRLGENEISFGEERNAHPELMHAIKVLLTLNNLEYRERERTHFSFVEKKSYKVVDVIAKNIVNNDLSCTLMLNSKGYEFTSSIDNKLNVRLRYIVYKHAKIQKEQIHGIYSIMESIENLAEPFFSRFQVNLTGSNRGDGPSTYIDINIEK